MRWVPSKGFMEKCASKGGAGENLLSELLGRYGRSPPIESITRPRSHERGRLDSRISAQPFVCQCQKSGCWLQVHGFAFCETVPLGCWRTMPARE